jgi:hypothetical protein
MLDMAQNDTASVTIDALDTTADGKLQALVTITNNVGHFLPSGVGFRRVFLELLVLDAQDNVLWASGRTNALGAIVDGITDQVLPSEQSVKFPQAFQPHYTSIDSGDQVQIYEERLKDSAGNLTTSFVRRVTPVKDNRLRPKGFDRQFFAQNPSPFIQELAELPGDEQLDPDYTDPQRAGADQIAYVVPLDAATLARVARVRATLYYQATPPYYLQERFQDATVGPGNKDDIARLYYLTSHLNVGAVTDAQGTTALKDWKVQIGADSKPLR